MMSPTMQRSGMLAARGSRLFQTSPDAIGRVAEDLHVPVARFACKRECSKLGAGESFVLARMPLFTLNAMALSAMDSHFFRVFPVLEVVMRLLQPWRRR